MVATEDVVSKAKSVAETAGKRPLILLKLQAETRCG